MKSIFLFCLVMIYAGASASDTTAYSRSSHIYGLKDGMAMMLEKIQPDSGNKKAIICIVSGNFKSSIEWIPEYIKRMKPYLKSGFTVFAMVPSSQPRYTIPEQLQDVRRAIRYIRYNAKQFNIDPERIGITGSSSGGNLALLAATVSEFIPGYSVDPVMLESSSVQAVAVFYPPTDFINYGKPNKDLHLNYRLLRLTGVAAAFDFKTWNDSTKTYVSETDEQKIIDIVKGISPINHLSAEDPPVFIIHGDKDFLVPLQQSESFISKAREIGIQATLEVKKGGGHSWPKREEDDHKFAAWFNEILLQKP